MGTGAYPKALSRDSFPSDSSRSVGFCQRAAHGQSVNFGLRGPGRPGFGRRCAFAPLACQQRMWGSPFVMRCARSRIRRRMACWRIVLVATRACVPMGVWNFVPPLYPAAFCLSQLAGGGGGLCFIPKRGSRLLPSLQSFGPPLHHPALVPRSLVLGRSTGMVSHAPPTLGVSLRVRLSPLRRRRSRSVAGVESLGPGLTVGHETACWSFGRQPASMQGR